MENTLLNLVPASYLPEVHLSQYDVGRELKFTLKDGSSDYTVPSGAVVTVKATKPSGLGFVVNATAEGSVVTLSNTETMTNENGRFPAELSITQGSTVIGTSNFIFNVERSPHPEGTIDGDAESLLPELTLLVERIEAAADSVDEDTQIVTDAKAEVLQAKADTLQAKADTLTARDDALQAKADAITAKESAEASAQAAAESAQEAEDTLSEYAKVDGYYEEMAVGSAEQLLSTQFVEDSVPYKFRTSGGSKDIGNREYDEIVGGSIVWNQLFRPINATRGGITITDNGDGTQTLNGTTTQNAIALNNGSIQGTRNHIVFLVDTKHNIKVYSGHGDQGSTNGIIFRNIYENTISTYMWAPSGTVFDNTKVCVQCFDLTLMLGSQVADYIYSLESAETGKGVAFFKSLFPNDYYPYNAGELLSVEGLQSHDTVGFNQWDEEWELGAFNTTTGVNSYSASNIRSKNYIPVVPNATYYFNVPSYVWTIFFDADKNVITDPIGGYPDYQADGNSRGIGDIYKRTVTMPSNCHYIRFYCQVGYGNTYKNDICINLSWSGWRNGEYEPYKKHSYALDSSLTLRGILKLNASNELYFDGDIYSHDGKVQRRYGIVDLGTLNWVYNSKNTAFYTLGLTSLIKKGTGIKANIVCLKYPTYNDGDPLTKDKIISSTTVWGQGNIVVKDSSYTDATAFKNAMNGVMLIYELATPTEETATPFEEVQIVDDFGTEEYISGNLVPVGHNTKYPANLRDKLQHLPNMADSDGAYLIRQTNKQMSLEVFRIPKAPTTDGTYILKATVSGGTPTYTWEAVE